MIILYELFAGQIEIIMKLLRYVRILTIQFYLSLVSYIEAHIVWCMYKFITRRKVARKQSSVCDEMYFTFQIELQFSKNLAVLYLLL